jgi:hypothetical protein
MISARRAFILALVSLSSARVAQGQSNLPSGIFIAIPPCRVIDTRKTAQGAFTAGQKRTFNVVGPDTDLSQQGGSSNGCGIPGFFTDQANNSTPGVAAVEINYVAVDAVGPGNLKAWPSDQFLLKDPDTAIINFQKLTPNLNIANGTVTSLRQDVQGDDLTIKASNGVHVVADVVGFYALPGFQNSNPGFLASVTGGHDNTAAGSSAVVGGGEFNLATGTDSFIGGGFFNFASGNASVALGSNANADNDGDFVFSDDSVDGFGSTIPFHSTVPKEFAARAVGGFRFVTAVDGDGNTTKSCAIDGNANLTCNGTINEGSNRDSKMNVSPVDGRGVLARVAALPIHTWTYKGDRPSVRHIGPMADDFAAAFRVGADDKHIAVVDADGVELAAIQALYRMLQDKSSEIARLEKEVSTQRAEIAYLRDQSRILNEIQARLGRLEKRNVAVTASIHR